MKKNQVSKPRLFDYEGVVSDNYNQRWFIQCSYWDNEGKYQRKRYYEFNDIPTIAERYRYAHGRLPAIQRELEAQD